jgi:predicted SnoaL-like aldol condensation-catalyzing enzyme
VIPTTGLREDGDKVFFRMELKMPDPDTGQLVKIASDHVWRFDESGKVVEVWPADLAAVSRAFEAMHIEPR